MEEDDLDPDQLDVGILHLNWSLITRSFEKLVMKFRHWYILFDVLVKFGLQKTAQKF